MGLAQELLTTAAGASTSAGISGGLATPSSILETGPISRFRSEIEDQSSAVGNEQHTIPQADLRVELTSGSSSMSDPGAWNFDWMIGMEMNDFSVLSISLSTFSRQQLTLVLVLRLDAQ